MHINSIPVLYLGKKRGKVAVLQAEFQADSVLAYRRANYISDVVFSSDTDLLAHAGPMCFGIKFFTYTARGKKAGIDNIEVFTADMGMLDTILSSLHWPIEHENVKKSRNPIFDGIISPKTRALLAVGLGCDVYQSGIRGVTKVVLKEWLDVHKNEYDNPTLLHNNLLIFSVTDIIMTTHAPKKCRIAKKYA